MAVQTFSPVAELSPRDVKRRSQTVFAALEKEIVLGLLEPEATLLELELAQRFTCSQGTVREALLRLSEEGLVNRLPRRGTRVAPCRSDDARALLAIRNEIECRYLSRAVANFHAGARDDLMAEMNAMRNAARDGDEYLLSVHDRRFHLRLFDTADLPVVTPMLARCLIHNHRFKILRWTGGRDLDETAERHRPIIDALDTGDADKVREVLSHHISTVVDFGPDIMRDGPS